MFSRRVFMKNGGMALLSLGFAPAFLARSKRPAPRAGKISYDLSAQGRRRPQA